MDGIVENGWPEIPEGWTGPIFGKYVEQDGRKVWLTDGEFCISDEGGWIPGVFQSFDAALEGFEDYYRSLAPDA